MRINNNQIDPFQYLNRMERFATLLTDVRYCFAGKAHRMSRENIVLMLDDIVHEEHLFYMIIFMGAYYVVKKENKTEEQREDSIKAMKLLMGWEKQSIRNKVTTAYSLRFSKEDLTEDEEINTPAENFDILINLFYEKGESIKNFIHSRPFYKEVLIPPPQATLYVCILLGKVSDFFRSKINQSNWEQLEDAMEDIFEVLLEWISIVAGLTHYHLKYNLGTEKQVDDLLDALKDMNGYKNHRKLGDPTEPLNFNIPDEVVDNTSIKQIDFVLIS